MSVALCSGSPRKLLHDFVPLMLSQLLGYLVYHPIFLTESDLGGSCFSCSLGFSVRGWSLLVSTSPSPPFPRSWASDGGCRGAGVVKKRGVTGPSEVKPAAPSRAVGPRAWAPGPGPPPPALRVLPLGIAQVCLFVPCFVPSCGFRDGGPPVSS